MAEQAIELVENEITYRDRTLEYEEVELSAGPIEYVDEGTRDPVVFLHGFMVNAEVWRKVLPRLRDEFRCIAPTLPLGGHHRPVHRDADLSPPGLVEMVGEFLDHLGIERATFVGNDAGGALCQLFVATYPDRVRRLVLTNCDALEAFPPKLFRPLQYASHVPGFTSFVAHALRFDRVRRLPFTFGWLSKQNLSRETLDQYVQDFVANPPIRRDAKKMLQAVRPDYTIEAASSFPHYEKPVLLLWGREDPIFPIEHAERLADLFPEATLEYLEDSYAFVPEDQPVVLANRIGDFVSESAPPIAGTADTRNAPVASSRQ